MLTLAACRSCDSRKSLPSVLYGPFYSVSCLWITFFHRAVGCSGHSQIVLPPRRASARRSGSPGAIGRFSGVSKHQSAPPRRSCSGRPATASRGGVPLPARGWLDALGSSSAPELRMIPGPPPAINGKHVTTTATSRHATESVDPWSFPRPAGQGASFAYASRFRVVIVDPCSRLGRDATKLSCVSDPHGQHMTTTATSRHAKIGVERPSTPHAHTGESGATPGAALTTSPSSFPLHQPPRPCRASEDARRHRAGGRQEPAALLHPPGPDARDE